MIKLVCIVIAATQLTPFDVAPTFAEGWMAGVARVDITPETPMWMSGYGGRDKVAEGKLTDLWAKSLVLKDAAGNHAVTVTLDLVGIDRDTSLAIRRGICDRHQLELANVALFTSHTHTGPVVGTNLLSMYKLTPEQIKQINDYTERLIQQVGEVVDHAFADLEPAVLSAAVGEATFAVNRRNNKEGDVPRLREEGLLKGPVDHRVPVLRIQTDDKLKAVVFGYACHATVLSFYQWSGDYPGFAQLEVETRHPGTTAMFVAGCGADQNPLPRRTVELAQGYGKQLAEAVESVLAEPMNPVTGNFAAKYEEIPLAFAELPSRVEIENNAKLNHYEAGRARRLLKQWDEQGSLAKDYPYPIQTWRFGDGPIWVVMGGEVVVDFAIRIRHDFGDRFWTAGYANDVMAYIPSRRILTEGGYEGARAMLYYGLPSAWEAEVERKIMQTISEQIEGLLVDGAR